MNLIILGISLFLFLYVLHYYVRDDFIIFRKNVSLEEIFDMAFKSFVFVFLLSRIFYIADNFNTVFLNPLVFLVFPYYPGFSLTGGLIGGAIFLLWYVKKKKFPGKRIFDFFSIATLWSITAYSLTTNIIFRNFSPGSIVESILFLILLGLFIKPFIPKYLSGKIKDGFLTGIFCIGYSVASFAGNLGQGSIRDISFEVLALVIVFFFGLIFILKEELMPKVRDLK